MSGSISLALSRIPEDEKPLPPKTTLRAFTSGKKQVYAVALTKVKLASLCLKQKNHKHLSDNTRVFHFNKFKAVCH